MPSRLLPTAVFEGYNRPFDSQCSDTQVNGESCGAVNGHGNGRKGARRDTESHIPQEFWPNILQCCLATGIFGTALQWKSPPARQFHVGKTIKSSQGFGGGSKFHHNFLCLQIWKHVVNSEDYFFSVELLKCMFDVAVSSSLCCL
jgi:hypothetical protein